MDWIPYPRFLLRKNAIKKILREESLEGKVCLEVGYGSGEMLKYFADKGMCAYGFDFSDEAFDTAVKRTAKYGGKIILEKSLEEIKGLKFDYIFSFEVLEHMKDDRATVSTWHKMLGDDGRILISVPAHKGKYGKLDQSVGHYRRYDREDVFSLFENNGFSVVKLWNFGYPLSNWMEYIENQFVKNNDFKNDSKEDLSKKSFKGNASVLIRFISNDVVLFPFYTIQNIFYRESYGSGILCLAKKERP